MQIPKDMIVSMIENRLGGAQAQQAAQQLPDQVDHEQHGSLLSKFGINPQEIISQLGGAQAQANQGRPHGGEVRSRRTSSRLLRLSSSRRSSSLMVRISTVRLGPARGSDTSRSSGGTLSRPSLG